MQNEEKKGEIGAGDIAIFVQFALIIEFGLY